MDSFELNDLMGNPLSVNPLNDKNTTNEDGGRNKKAIMENSDFVPSDIYFDSSNLDPDTNLPVEYGNFKYIKGKEPINANILKEKRKSRYDKFDYNKGSKDFLFGLDKPIPVNRVTSDGIVSQINLKEIYLGSYLGTPNDNEDPVMFGYDLVIDAVNSPLFNGSIEDFINSPDFSEVTEITSRLSVLNEFKYQFFKFFRFNIDSSDEVKKIHYFKGISGLENLANRYRSDTKNMQFVDYGEEFITLSLMEDVSLNMGYLSSLYNDLCWSKINGKLIIPENLLRFNVKLVVSEIRRYNRIIKNGDKMDVLADRLSRYVYDLYECQFFFDENTHYSDLDNSSPKVLDNFNFRFNYKFHTRKFEKFDFFNGQSKYRALNNLYQDVTSVRPIDTNNSYIGEDGSINNDFDNVVMNVLDTIYSDVSDIRERFNNLSPIELLKLQERLNSARPSLFNKLIRDLVNAGVRETNRIIVKKLQGVNKSIDKYRNTIWGLGKIKEPKNVYDNSTQFENDLKNSIGNFLGGSISNLIGKKF